MRVVFFHCFRQSFVRPLYFSIASRNASSKSNIVYVRFSHVGIISRNAGSRFGYVRFSHVRLSHVRVRVVHPICVSEVFYLRR